MKPFIRQCFVITTTCLNLISFGCCVGFPAVLLPQLRDDSSIPVAKDKQSWIGVVITLTMKPLIRQCFITAAVCFNIISFGCCVGFPAVLLPQLKQDDSTIRIVKSMESWIAAVFPLLSLVGNALTPFIMERYGRKIANYTTTLFMLSGWFLITLATSVEVLLVGRILQGIAGGIMNILRSILIGEYTSPKYRGAFLMTSSLSQAFGIFLVHLLGSLLSWQKTALISVFFSFASLVMVIYTPESPSWLLTKGKQDEFRRVFLWLRGPEEKEELESMIKARLAFENANNEEKEGSQLNRILSIVRRNEFFKPILIVFHFTVMMHLAGGTTMAAYSMLILSHLMGPEANAHFWMVFLDFQRIISNAAAVYVISRVKRRIMVFSTTMICILSQASMAVYIYWAKSQATHTLWIPALLINMQMFSVATGMVPMPNVIAGEVFPLAYRGIGGMISILSGSVFMFVILKTFPMLIDNMGLHGTYALYAVVLLVNLCIIWLLLPETKGKTLQEIEDGFSGKSQRDVEELKSLRSNQDIDQISSKPSEIIR